MTHRTLTQVTLMTERVFLVTNHVECSLSDNGSGGVWVIAHTVEEQTINQARIDTMPINSATSLRTSEKIPGVLRRTLQVPSLCEPSVTHGHASHPRSKHCISTRMSAQAEPHHELSSGFMPSAALVKQLDALTRISAASFTPYVLHMKPMMKPNFFKN